MTLDSYVHELDRVEREITRMNKHLREIREQRKHLRERLFHAMDARRVEKYGKYRLETLRPR